MIYLIQSEITLKAYYSVPVIKNPNILPGCTVYYKKDGNKEIKKFWKLKELIKSENIKPEDQLYHIPGLYDCDLDNGTIMSCFLVRFIRNDFYKMDDLVNPESKLGEKVEIKESIWTKIKSWFKHNI